MPEGHTIHRAARDQRPHLKGRVLAVSSPQGRFLEGASQLDGKRCRDVEAFGKHLLYPFTGGLNLHLHLGLYGKVRTAEGQAPEPRGLVRVRLEAPDYTVDVNGPAACEVLDAAGRKRLLARLGPDPLRTDADPDRAWTRITKSRTALGVLLMDQSVIAGVGNIYRSELLWRAELHPRLPGHDLSRPAFDAIWADTQRLMEIGVETGLIITVDGATPKTPRARRFNIYKRKTCPRCGGPVTVMTLAGRKAYACEHDAPPPP